MEKEVINNEQLARLDRELKILFDFERSEVISRAQTQLALISLEARSCQELSLISVNQIQLVYALLKTNKKATAGIDGVTYDDFMQNLKANIEKIEAEIIAGTYKPLPWRRSYIPKAKGERPIAIPSMRDKLVQRNLSNILGAVFEPLFSESSFAFRRGVSREKALAYIKNSMPSIRHLFQVDVEQFFPKVCHELLYEILAKKPFDKTLLHLTMSQIKGVVVELDGAETRYSKRGIAQGTVLAPMLSNIYLHEAVDSWFWRDFQPISLGRCFIARYCDDLLFGFEYEVDKHLLKTQLVSRLASFRLKINEDKTQESDW